MIGEYDCGTDGLPDPSGVFPLECPGVAPREYDASPETDVTSPPVDLVPEDIFIGNDTYTVGDEYTEDDGTTGGYENDWELVLIVDSPDNTVDTCNAGNPGADIDAVEIYRDGDLWGWGISVEALDNDIWGGNWLCDNADNDKDDPEEVLGQADGTANSDDGFSGYFSLNGRTVYLLMSEILENGDELVIYEMFNADNPDATIEDYKVYLGYYTDDGDMAFNDEAFSDWNTGTVAGTIDGLW